MLLFKTIILALCFCSLSSFTFAGDLIAGINYGDTRDTVMKKLSDCKLVKSTMPKTMFARLGMNGAYKTTNELSGLKFALYFDWTDSRGLRQMNYRSDGLPSHDYDKNLRYIWEKTINLLSSMHGKPKNAGEYPKKSELKPNTILFSHEWKTGTGYIYLGVGQDTSKYSLNITFSKVSLSS